MGECLSIYSTYMCTIILYKYITYEHVQICKYNITLEFHKAKILHSKRCLPNTGLPWWCPPAFANLGALLCTSPNKCSKSVVLYKAEFETKSDKDTETDTKGKLYTT